MDTLFRDTVKAMATGDTVTAGELTRRITPDDRDDYTLFVTAFFAVAIGHRFAADRSRDAIDHFVSEMRRDYKRAEPPFTPLAMEGLIRGLFGEEHLLDEISPESRLRCQFMAIRKIVEQSPEMKSRIDDFLADAQLLSRAWNSESSSESD